MENFISSFKKHKFIFIVSILYGFYNLVLAIKIDFESMIFLPFRHEGLLFFRNAILSNSKAFFFIRDWSTSFLPEEHPLLYFHNMDLAHFFAGFIQYFFPSPKIILFILSLLISLIGLFLVWNNLKPLYGNLFASVFIGLLILPTKGFLVSPQNFFCTITLFFMVWHFILLRKIWDCNEVNYKLGIQLFLLFLLAAATETNLCLILLIIMGLFTLYTSKSLLTRECIKRNFLIIFFSVLPFILIRALQFGAVLYYGYRPQFVDDLQFTSKLKVQSNIDLVEAVKFYADKGITFFGQGEPQSIASNIKNLTHFYAHQFNYALWIPLFIFCLLIIIIRKVPLTKFALINNKINKKSDQTVVENISFLCLYLVCFVVATYTILFFTGDAIMKISMAAHGFMDLTLIYRAIFVILIPWLIFISINNPNHSYVSKFKYLLFTFTILFFIYQTLPSFTESKRENFSYKKALKFIPPNADVITNFEPSIVAIETGSRVNMSWFAQPPDSCQLMDSQRLLKMYKVRSNSANKNDLYVFLACHFPYGSDRASLEERHCISKENFKLLYSDPDCAVYKKI